MKKSLLLLFALAAGKLLCQEFTTNVNPVGMEHNLLFNAHTRYTVKQEGSAILDTSILFDGKFYPSYTTVAPTASNPTIITIEGLPDYHIQAGAWVGWSTRYWASKRFKIEGYDMYLSANVWKVLSDYSSQDYNGRDFTQKISVSGSYTKLRFTFYEATGTDGRMGVSELFYIHPEATGPYSGLFNNINGTSGLRISGKNAISSVNGFPNMIELINGSCASIVYQPGTSTELMFGFHSNGNFYWGTGQSAGNNYCMYLSNAGDLKVYNSIGIGTTPNADGYKLNVNGKIRAKEIKVEAVWSDFVFEDDYSLRDINELERYIKNNKHLPDIPSASEVEENGVNLGEMDSKLLQKIEELTLYMIDLNKEVELLKSENKKLREKADRKE